MTELLRVELLSCHFAQGDEYLAAVDGVSLSLAAGEVLGLVGESGSGKSTLGRLIAGLETPSSGDIYFAGQRLSRRRSGSALRAQGGDIQMVFQDSYASLNPRMTIAASLAEPLQQRGCRGAALRSRVDEWLERVGLGQRFAGRYPHQLSGGQRQRVGIARAFITEPQLVICDEAVSALDVSVQAQILQLLREIQRDSATAMIFITHDLAVLGSLADRIAVMYLGELLELAPCWQLLEQPLHPYTRQLLAAHPEPVLAPSSLAVVARDQASELPTPLSSDMGCRFAGRCPYAQPECLLQPPWLRRATSGAAVACHRLDWLEAGASD